MIKANDIVYNVSKRSVFDIAETKYVGYQNDPEIPNEIVDEIKPFGSGPASINNMNGILLAGTPRCFVNPVLHLNTIIPGEVVADEYGMRPIDPMRKIPQSRPAPPVFIA